MDPIGYFTFVRDIPFRLPLSVHEPDHSCVGKHVVLKNLLSSLGFKVRYALGVWSWSSLDMPESLKEIPHVDRAVHFYLEVYNKEQARWMTVDATWDKGLAPKLPVSEWDGRSDTIIAVKPVEILKERRDEFDKASEAKWAEAIEANGKRAQIFSLYYSEVDIPSFKQMKSPFKPITFGSAITFLQNQKLTKKG